MTSIQQNEKQDSESPHTTQAFIVGFWGVRYQVKDVQRAITFYTRPRPSLQSKLGLQRPQRCLWRDATFVPGLLLRMVRGPPNRESILPKIN
jgi:hypothetical protein